MVRRVRGSAAIYIAILWWIWIGIGLDWIVRVKRGRCMSVDGDRSKQELEGRRG